eukprot:TRINITY_DN67792_c1_g4_i1.p1 TRINITY_DN67792_c1_g4~~TRINITY_DN67792_c1_g4_i1.p1  ORF type:complete len:315 (-),score=27.01 TRINITY_DN67792_c1_g4_i1:176-1120(-)
MTDVDEKDLKEMDVALVEAIKSGNIDSLRQFDAQYLFDVANSTRLEGPSDFLGEGPLHIAVFYGHQALIRFLIDKNADANLPTKMDKQSPLHIACAQCNMHVAKLLISLNADINAQQNNLYTPLHVAAQQGHLEMVTYLTDLGAKVDLVGKDGHTAASIARLTEHTKVAEFLEAQTTTKSNVYALEQQDSSPPPKARPKMGRNTHNPVRMMMVRESTAASTSKPWGPRKPTYGLHDISNVLIDEDDLREKFAEFDKDGNGYMSKREFVEFYKTLESYGCDDSKVDEMLATYNLAGTERITFEEFCVVMLHVAKR